MMEYTHKGALIAGEYRYNLWREWDGPGATMLKTSWCVFIMLNPSMADGQLDDPTIRKCVRFARLWKYQKLVVVNLFAGRATKPADLFKMANPIGSHNAHHIRETLDNEAGVVVCAWGMHGGFMDQDKAVMRLLDEAGVTPYALGLTKDGFPRHPLYYPYGKHIKFETPL